MIIWSGREGGIVVVQVWRSYFCSVGVKVFPIVSWAVKDGLSWRRCKDIFVAEWDLRAANRPADAEENALFAGRIVCDVDVKYVLSWRIRLRTNCRDKVEDEGLLCHGHTVEILVINYEFVRLLELNRTRDTSASGCKRKIIHSWQDLLTAWINQAVPCQCTKIPWCYNIFCVKYSSLTVKVYHGWHYLPWLNYIISVWINYWVRLTRGNSHRIKK